MDFKILVSNTRVEVFDYVKDYIEKNPEAQIMIGCDSQNKKWETIYAVVIGLYNPGKGAHVLYSRYSVSREKDNMGRLLKEVWQSVEIAEAIKAELGITAKWIDIDISEDKKYKSNQVLTSAVGIVTGMGYGVRHKGMSPLMTYAADKLVK